MLDKALKGVYRMSENSNDIMQFNGDLFSIIDNQYTVKQFKNEIQNSNSIIDKLAKATADGFNKGRVKTEESSEDEYRYIVNLTDDVKKAIANGDMKFNIENGNTFAQLRTKDGRYGEKLSISKELIKQGLTPGEAALAMQTQLIHEDLMRMMDILDAIGTNVQNIIQGQHNDRVGLFYSGLNLYLESKSVKDSTLKKYIAAQAIKSLSDANAQLTQEIQMDIQYLLDRDYKSEKRKAVVSAIDEKMMSIRKSYDVIHQSYVLKSFIYYEMKELDAMLASFSEYGNFISKVIANNAARLSEYDVNDNSLTKGFWDKKIDVLDNITDMRDKIANTNVFYLSNEEDKDA